MWCIKSFCLSQKTSNSTNHSSFCTMAMNFIRSFFNNKFYLLGVGYHSPYLEEMQKRISELHIEDNIILQPWLLHDDCLEYVRKSMFYLTVSLYEGLPLSVIEAMSLGKAVVASDVTGNKDCVINGVNGYLLPFDADVFAQKILELLKNEDRRKTFEINSRKIYLSKFQIEKQIFMLQTIYRRS